MKLTAAENLIQCVLIHWPKVNCENELQCDIKWQSTKRKGATKMILKYDKRVVDGVTNHRRAISRSIDA